MTAAIVIRASQATGVPIEAILGRSRSRPLCWVRWAVMAALRAKGCSTVTIGRLLRRHPSTVHVGLLRADGLMVADDGFLELVEALG